LEGPRKEQSHTESGVERNTTLYSLLSTPPKELPLFPEPADLRAETRAFLEDSPEEGISLVNAGHPLADLLWEEWGEKLEGAGMSYEKFLQTTRGYAGEIRLWVMGERMWDHCVSGLAGRLLRRLPDKRRGQEPTLVCCSGEGR
jgi:hypothetical protein